MSLKCCRQITVWYHYERCPALKGSICVKIFLISQGPRTNEIEGKHALVPRPSARLWPSPDLPDPPSHVNFLLHHRDNPRVGQHVLWSGSCGCVNGESRNTLISKIIKPKGLRRCHRDTHVSLMNSFISSVHWTPGSSSSRGGYMQ